MLLEPRQPRPASARKRLWRPAVVLAVALSVCLAAAQPAAAGQIVWNKGDSAIWAMNDDGSNQHQLTGLPPGGISTVATPHTAPNGATVVFEGITTQYAQQNGLHTYYGNFGFGVYKWEAGAATRLSPPPSQCGGGTCEQSQADPEATTDGRFLFISVRNECNVGCSGNPISNGYHGFGSLSGGGFSDFGARACPYAGDGTTNPANPSEMAYDGCWNSDSSNPASTPGTYAVIASGPNRAGEHVLATDDQTIHDPSWNSNGTQLIDVETGDTPGLVVYRSPTDNTVVLNDPTGGTGDSPFHDPRFAGDRIVFGYQPGDGTKDLYSIPASCAGCNFPANATRLTTDGNNSQPAWTSVASFPTPFVCCAPVVLAAASRLGIAPGAFPAAPSGPPALTARRKPRRKYGAQVSYVLNLAATVRFTVQQAQPGRKTGTGRRARCVAPTKGNRRARRCTRIVTLGGSFTRSARAGSNKFRFTGRLGGRKLKPGKYTLVATPSANGRTGRSVSKAFRIIK
jgi:hypothetical protein